MRFLALGSFVLLAACSPAPPSAPPPPRPAVSAVASVSASASGEPAPSRPAPHSKGLFHIAMLSDEEGEPIVLKQLGSTLFLLDESSGVPLQFDDEAWNWDPTILKGLGTDFLNANGAGAATTIVDLAGDWPNRAWMVTLSGHPRAGGWNVFAWKVDHWTPQPKLLPAPISLYGWIHELESGRFLLNYDSNRVTDQPMESVWLDGGPARKLAMPCFESPADAASTSSGDLFVVAAKATRCRGATQDPSVTGSVLFVWDAGAQSPGLVALPNGFEPEGVHARSKSDVWIAGTSGDQPAAAHFDGRSVEVTSLPGHGSPHSVASEPDGTVWVAGSVSEDSSGVWRRTTEGVWSEVILPVLAQASRVVARGQGDVWVSANSPKGRFVFRTLKPPVIFHAPSRELRWDVIYRLGRRDLPLPLCNRIVVAISRDEDKASGLATLNRAVAALRKPKEIAVAKTTKDPALWVASVPDTATGELLKKKLKKLDPSLAPQLVCRENVELLAP